MYQIARVIVLAILIFYGIIAFVQTFCANKVFERIGCFLQFISSAGAIYFMYF